MTQNINSFVVTKLDVVKNMGYDTKFYFKGKKIVFDSKSRDSAEKFSRYSGYRIWENENNTFGFYNPDSYYVDTYLYYKGDELKPEQPINIKHYAYTFTKWKGKALDLDDWDMEIVDDISYMFYDASHLQFVKCGTWNTSNIRRMDNTFCWCDKLIAVNCGSWDTKNVTTMRNMFKGCSKIERLDVGEWDVRNVMDMSYMFCDCERLRYLDISGWEMNKDLKKSHMTRNCVNLPFKLK